VGRQSIQNCTPEQESGIQIKDNAIRVILKKKFFTYKK